MQVISLHCGALRAEVLPEAAGGLARFDLERGGAPQPLLRPYVHTEGVPKPTTSQLACFPLVPWSNRIHPDGFVFGGRAVTPAPNRPGEPCPIHGDGWQHPWRVGAQSGNGVSLTLDRRDAPFSSPFSYVAQLRYMLTEAALNVTLEVTNTGSAPLPFGLGLHPWFERRAGVTLRARSAGTWASGPLGLPGDEIALPPEWNFATPQALPQGHVDHVFCGWDGRAEIRWPDAEVQLTVQADMGYYVLYAPSGADFFCFEPVDHAINAHNLPGGALRHGLTSLAPGRTLARRVSFRVEGQSRSRAA